MYVHMEGSGCLCVVSVHVYTAVDVYISCMYIWPRRVYLSLYKHTYNYIYMSNHVLVSPLLYVHVYIYMYICVTIHTCMYICMYVYIYVCMYTYLCIYLSTLCTAPTSPLSLPLAYVLCDIHLLMEEVLKITSIKSWLPGFS